MKPVLVVTLGDVLGIACFVGIAIALAIVRALGRLEIWFEERRG